MTRQNIKASKVLLALNRELEQARYEYTNANNEADSNYYDGKVTALNLAMAEMAIQGWTVGDAKKREELLAGH